MLGRNLSLALTLLMGPVAFSQATVSTNVSFALQGTFAGGVPVGNNIHATGSGSGVFQPFGNVTLVLSAVAPVNGPGATGTFSLIFQSGESLTLAFVVPPIDNGRSDGTGTFTGGTGQFSGATGTVTFGGPGSDTSLDITGSGTLVQAAATVKPASAAPSSLTFKFAAGASVVIASQPVALTNGSSSANTFTATVKGGPGLSVSPANGTIGPYAASSVSVTANVTGSGAATYSAAVNISFGSGESFSIPVTVIVAQAAAPAVAPAGVQFAGVAGVSFPESATVTLLNVPSGTVSVSTTAAAGDSSCLSAVAGATSATISVNAKTLQAGVYYGRVEFTLPPPNLPLEVTVVFNVTAANAPVTPTLNTTALVFFGSSLSGSVQLSDPGSTTLAVTTQVAYLVGSNWLTVTPASATIPSAGSTKFTISADPAALQPAIQTQTIFRASVQFVLPSGAIVPLEVIYLPSPPGSSSAAFSGGGRAATCVRTLIAPAFTKLPSAFLTTAGWPVPIEVEVFDNCGVPVTAGILVEHVGAARRQGIERRHHRDRENPGRPHRNGSH